MVEPSRLETGLRRLARFPVTGDNTADLVREAVAAAQRMPGVSGAGLMLVDPDQTLRHAVASDEPAMQLELRQEEAGEGPCVDACRRGTVLATADLGTDPRWPALAPLVTSLPARAVLAVPTTVGGSPVGTLNVYAERRRDWSDAEVTALGAFAGVLDQLLASSLAQDRSDQLAQQLQYALDYRVVIERAVGYLMHRERLDSEQAFARLHAAARNSRRKVVDVAAEVLAGRPLPAPVRKARR